MKLSPLILSLVLGSCRSTVAVSAKRLRSGTTRATPTAATTTRQRRHLKEDKNTVNTDAPTLAVILVPSSAPTSAPTVAVSSIPSSAPTSAPTAVTAAPSSAVTTSPSPADLIEYDDLYALTVYGEKYVGRYDVACRVDGGKGKFDKEKDIYLSTCQQTCTEDEDCVGYEYNADDKACEYHKESGLPFLADDEGAFADDEEEGIECFWKIGSDGDVIVNDTATIIGDTVIIPVATPAPSEAATASEPTALPSEAATTAGPTVNATSTPAPTPPPTYATFRYIDDDPTITLRVCEGDCDNDDDCEGGLVCMQRSDNEPVPGCGGTARDEKDYCIQPP